MKEINKGNKKANKDNKQTSKQTNKKTNKMSETKFKPLKPEQIDTSKIEIGQLKKLDNGASIAYVNLSSKPIYVKTSEFGVPFGAQYWPDSVDNSGKWSVKVNLKGEGSETMVQMLRDFDTKIKEEAIKNCVSWFKKRNLTADTIDTLYTPMLKESLDPETGEPNGKYPPGFAFKIVKRDGNVSCKVYLTKDHVYNLTEEGHEKYANLETLIGKGSRVKLLLRCNGIWVANGKFGCTWRAEQIKVSPAESFDEYAFDETDEEVERIDGNFVDSSDEETEKDNEGTSEEETDAAEVKQKRVRKVKKNN